MSQRSIVPGLMCASIGRKNCSEFVLGSMTDWAAFVSSVVYFRIHEDVTILLRKKGKNPSPY